MDSKTDHPYLEVGCAVYQELGILANWILPYNHAALYTGVIITHDNQLISTVVHSNGDGVHMDRFSVIYEDLDWGGMGGNFGRLAGRTSLIKINF